MFVFLLPFHPHFSSHLFNGRLEAMAHPRCVGWGEIGLDYHYDNSPRDIQQSIFIRQLRNAVKLRKSITVHTREAEEDTERILKEEVPKDHRMSSDGLVGFILVVFDACFRSTFTVTLTRLSLLNGY